MSRMFGRMDKLFIKYFPAYKDIWFLRLGTHLPAATPTLVRAAAKSHPVAVEAEEARRIVTIRLHLPQTR